MNPQQFARQMRYLLLSDTWADSPGEVVFGAPAANSREGGGVVVTAGPSEEAIKGMGLRPPFCLIYVDDVEADPEEPGLLLQTFGVVLVAAVEGDPFGERVLMGGPKASVGQSYGRGILEVEAKVRARIGKLTGADGARAVLAYTGSSSVERVGSKAFAARRYLVRAWCTSEPHYDAPVHLVATGGSGQVALTWTLPPARFDRLSVILRRASGSTAPTSATDGTGVTLSGATATSVTDTVAAGTYSYALFESYDETGSGSAERYSSQVLGSYRNGVVAT